MALDASGWEWPRAATYGEGRELRGDRRLLNDVLGVGHAREHGGRDGGGNSVELHDGAISPTWRKVRPGEVVEKTSQGRENVGVECAN